MHASPLLGPIVALVAWSLIMQIWLYVSRFAAMKRAARAAFGVSALRPSIESSANA